MVCFRQNFFSPA